jgi:hypothetical protein
MTAAATPEMVFQPHKAQRTGRWGAVRARVPICIREEPVREAVQRHDPSGTTSWSTTSCVLAAMKLAMRHRVTTVFVRRRHYALEPAQTAGYPAGTSPSDASTLWPMSIHSDGCVLPAKRTTQEKLQ